MSFVIFILVLSALVLIHEAGHYLAARLFGVKAEEFGIGFPPRIFGYVRDRGKWKRITHKDDGTYRSTIWSVNWLPLGGFVRIKGEQEDGINDPDSLHAKPIWKRVTIIAAGVLMNWLLAIALFTGLFAVGTRAILDELPPGASVADRTVAVTQVLKGSPAANAGILPGDEIRSIEGRDVPDAETLRRDIGGRGTQRTRFVIARDGEERTVEVAPALLPEIGRTGVGVALADVGTVSFPLPQAFANGVQMTFFLTKAIIFAFGGIFKDLVVSQKVAEDVAGPVGIAVMTGQVAKQGIAPLIQFAAMLSVNLAVINFLPIPALDGGRVLFLFIEKLRRRPVSRHLEIAIHNVAFLILILLILLVTARDLFRYGGVIAGGVKGLVGM